MAKSRKLTPREQDFKDRMALIGQKPEEDGSWNLDYEMEINPRYANPEKAFTAIAKLPGGKLEVARGFLLMDEAPDEEVRQRLVELMEPIAAKAQEEGLLGSTSGWMGVGPDEDEGSLDNEEFVAVALLHYLGVLEAGGIDVQTKSWDPAAQQAFRERLKLLGIELELIEGEDELDFDEGSVSLYLTADRDAFYPDKTRQAIKDLSPGQVELARGFLGRPDDADEQIRRRLGRMFAPLQRSFENYRPQYEHDYALEVNFYGISVQDHDDQSAVIALLLNHLGALEPAGISSKLQVSNPSDTEQEDDEDPGAETPPEAEKKQERWEELSEQEKEEQFFEAARELGVDLNELKDKQ